ncbi:MAG: hypothetical protein D3916_16135 [Candidatus Electrothrix sp. MAN1_4]|nr:hypothetical protein [Candidatus Electrothrix sp. MAN1_4]
MFVRYNHYRIYKEKSYNGSIWIHLFIMGLGIKNTLSQMSEWGGGTLWYIEIQENKKQRM